MSSSSSPPHAAAMGATARAMANGCKSLRSVRSVIGTLLCRWSVGETATRRHGLWHRGCGPRFFFPSYGTAAGETRANPTEYSRPDSTGGRNTGLLEGAEVLVEGFGGCALGSRILLSRLPTRPRALTDAERRARGDPGHPPRTRSWSCAPSAQPHRHDAPPPLSANASAVSSHPVVVPGVQQLPRFASESSGPLK